MTDSDAGKIFVFEPSGKYVRAIGSLKGGEGYFKRPTGIAVDSAAQRIYVTDTLRDEVFVLDMQGNILQTIGKTGDGEANSICPPNCVWSGQNLLVVDAMNFRVQVFDRTGKFQVRHRKDWRQHRSDVPAKGGECRFGRRPLCCGCPVGRGAGLQSPGPAALLLRRQGYARRRISACRRGCSSTMTTRFSSWIRSIAGSGVSLRRSEEARRGEASK